MKCLAAVLEKINSPLKLLELELPPLKDGQVLVKIAYTGLCQTQLNEVKGKKGADKFLPHTLGHEASGTILQVGSNVNKVKEGDHVVLSWLKGSGCDIPNTQYIHNKQIINSGAISTFMTHAIVSENRVIPICKSISLKEAALLGCALPTGMGIVINQLRMKPGSTIAIFGLGGIGLSALVAAKLLYASHIIAIDVQDHKLEIAKKMGAHDCINASKTDVVSKVLELTSNKGVDYSIEAAGNKHVMETAYKCVRNFGGTCVIAGNISHNEKIEIDPFDLILGKKIIGSWGGESKIDDDINLYSQLLKESKIDLSPLISHEFELKDINLALEKLERGEILRGLIHLKKQT